METPRDKYENMPIRKLEALLQNETLEPDAKTMVEDIVNKGETNEPVGRNSAAYSAV